MLENKRLHVARSTFRVSREFISYIQVSINVFLEMRQPSLCIEEMHTAFFYFIYSTKTDEKLYNNHIN
jgi:hypothetical protein